MKNLKKVFLFYVLLISTSIAGSNVSVVPIEKPNIKIAEDGSVLILENTAKSSKITTQSTTKNNIVSTKNETVQYEFSGNKIDNKESTKIISAKNNNEVQNKKTEYILKENSNINNNDKKQEENKTVVKNDNKQSNKKQEENKTVVKNDNKQSNKKQEEILKENNDKITKDNKSNIEYVSLDNVDKKHLTKVVKSSNYSNSGSNNLNLINKIEQNLMYNTSGQKRQNNKNIQITKGEWSKEDLTEVQADSKLKITTKTSSNLNLNLKEKEDNNKITELKNKAFEATKLKEYEISVKLYKEILKINKDDNFIKLSLATTYHILGQYLQAKPLYIELLPVFPNSEQLISNLLSIIIQESPYEAIYLLPALAKKYSNSAVIQAQTSVAFTAVERYSEAIQYIVNAIYLNEENIEYKYNLAVLYDATKQYSKAYNTYKNVYENIQRNKTINISADKIEDRMKKIKRYL